MMMTEKYTTQQLIGRAAQGDRAAFESLVARDCDELLRFVRSRLGSTLERKVDAEDIVQEVLLKAFLSLGTFRWQGEKSFSRWLAGIAHNLILHLARKHQRSDRIGLDPDAQAHSDSPSRGVRRDERLDRLQESLQSLSTEHREVVLLTRIDGLPIDEVAKRMNRSSKATRQLVWRALQNLRSSFGDTESLSLPDRRLRVEGDDDDG